MPDDPDSPQPSSGGSAAQRGVNLSAGVPVPAVRRLKIDLSDLELAFENSSLEMNCYLDLESGEVFVITDEVRREYEKFCATLREGWEEAPEAFTVALEQYNTHDWIKDELRRIDQVEAGFGSRYIAIPRIESGDAYRDMEDFITTIGEERLQDRLWDAIRGRGAFRRFKDVLGYYPHERERWFKFKDERLRERMVEWLEGKEIQLIEEEE